MAFPQLNESALFLDLDGTLFDIVMRPEDVIVPPGLVSLLADLEGSLGGALAIVTGRSIADVDRYLAPLRAICAGVHGAEMRTITGAAVAHVARTVPLQVRQAVEELRRAGDGVVIEHKSASIAVHYRLNPSIEASLDGELHRILKENLHDLILCRGRKVFEVVPKGVSKGTAIEALMRLPPFRGRRPIMIGDDVSDLSAFAAALRLDGEALKVGGEQFGPDCARFAGPAHVRAWLGAWAGRSGR